MLQVRRSDSKKIIESTEAEVELEVEIDTIEDKSRIELDETTAHDDKKREVFTEIYDDVCKVELPSTLWGIHKDPESQFIAFTMFDINQMKCSKVLKITDIYKMEIHVNGVEKSCEILNELSVDILTDLLRELDDYEYSPSDKKPIAIK